MGCAGSALVAACLAVENDAWLATTAALIMFGVAGEVAAERARGPGSFAMEIIDALHALNRVDADRQGEGDVMAKARARSSPLRHRRSGGLRRPRSRRAVAPARGGRHHAGAIARQAVRHQGDGRARPRHQGGAGHGAAADQRPRRRGARLRRRRRAHRLGRHGAGGCAAAARPRRHHRAHHQFAAARRRDRSRADRLRRHRRRLWHHLEGDQEHADRHGRAGARHRGAAPEASPASRLAASPASMRRTPRR